MRRTMNISVSEEMYSFISKRGQSYCYSSISEYIRSLVREDQFRSVEEPKPSRPLRRANEYFTLPDAQLDQD